MKYKDGIKSFLTELKAKTNKQKHIKDGQDVLSKKNRFIKKPL